MRRIRLVALAVAVLALPALAGAGPRKQTTGLLFKTLKHQGVERKYALYVPPDYDPDRKWPLIVFLNGAGECGTDGTKQAAQGLGSAILFKSAEWPFLVLFPQKPDVRLAWEDCDSMVMAMLERTRKDYKVDAGRVYLTGLSQGGHGTWVIGARHPDVWAAIAPVCGYGKPEEVAEGLRTVPVWAFHGEADGAVPVEQSRALAAAVTAAGGQVKLTTYPGVDHNSWDRAYRDEKLAEWFLSHTRP